jgi:hypothetical protein
MPEQPLEPSGLIHQPDGITMHEGTARRTVRHFGLDFKALRSSITFRTLKAP